MGKPSFKRYPMTTGGEMRSYWPNANYGNARTLKEYAGYPTDQPIWAVVPHGIFYEDDYVFPGEASAPVPCVLNYPSHRDGAWAATGKEVIPSAAPFLYAMEMYPHATERRGTIVMPQHLTTLYDLEGDLWEFAEACEKLPRPVTYLMYWEDLDRGFDKYFRGVIKTCGHVQDQRFLERLVGHLTGAEYVVSNEVGSYTQYATAAGAKFRLMARPPKFVLNEMGIANGFKDVFKNSDERHPEEQARVAEIDALFRDHDFDEPITEDQRDCSDYYLRRSAFKTRPKLLADLEYCREKKFAK